MAHGLRGENNECRESLSHRGGREEEEEGEEDFSLKPGGEAGSTNNSLPRHRQRDK